MQPNKIVRPGPRERTVLLENNDLRTIPESWDLLPPGDGPLTKLVKSKGPCWQVQIKKGRRTISKGIWTAADNIRTAQEEIAEKRSAPGYQDRRKKEHLRKEQKHQQYVHSFCNHVMQFLSFHPRYEQLGKRVAEAVTELATPVGSGTVARTTRIPIEARAKSAVVAWLRHQTTSYDSMKIPRIKGKRREIRRQLATQSLSTLAHYREGRDPLESCPLEQALQKQPQNNVNIDQDLMSKNNLNTTRL